MDTVKNMDIYYSRDGYRDRRCGSCKCEGYMLDCYSNIMLTNMHLCGYIIYYIFFLVLQRLNYFAEVRKMSDWTPWLWGNASRDGGYDQG